MNRKASFIFLFICLAFPQSTSGQMAPKTRPRSKMFRSPSIHVGQQNFFIKHIESHPDLLESKLQHFDKEGRPISIKVKNDDDVDRYEVEGKTDRVKGGKGQDDGREGKPDSWKGSYGQDNERKAKTDSREGTNVHHDGRKVRTDTKETNVHPDGREVVADDVDCKGEQQGPSSIDGNSRDREPLCMEGLAKTLQKITQSQQFVDGGYSAALAKRQRRLIGDDYQDDSS